MWPMYRSTLISRSRTAEAHPYPYLRRDRENVDYVHIEVFLNEPVQWTDRWEETGGGLSPFLFHPDQVR